MGHLERRRERYRRFSPVLHLFPAVLWLVLIWLSFFFGAIFASDSGTPEALRGAEWLAVMGFLLGLAPLVTVIALLIRRRLNPPVGRGPRFRLQTDWRLYGALTLISLVLLGLNSLPAH